MIDPATVTELDPVVRTLAERRANEAGQSLSEYIATLILQPTHPRGPEGQFAPLLGLRSGSEATQAWANLLVRYQPTASHDLCHRGIEENWRNFAPSAAFGPTSEHSTSPTLQLVVNFNVRIHSAALLMSAAFHEAAVTDFEFSRYRRAADRLPKTGGSTWYRHVVDDCLAVSKQVGNALVHDWNQTPRAERLAIDAFIVLSDLTPAGTELLRLCRYDRPRAFSELAKHLDLAADQFRLSADLLAEVEGSSSQIETTDDQRFAEISAALLDRVGGGLSLTEGSKLLGITRQALHKRVKSGSALGMMRGDELVLPRFQFVAEHGRAYVLEGLAKVVALFDRSGAGRWSTLQFLADRDANLADVPRHALAEGRIDDVVNAAKAYLDADEA